jgi:hypothetical protein
MADKAAGSSAALTDLECPGWVFGQDLRPILVGDLECLDRRSMNRVEKPSLLSERPASRISTRISGTPGSRLGQDSPDSI